MTIFFFILLFLPAVCAIPVYFLCKCKNKENLHALFAVSFVCLFLALFLYSNSINCSISLGNLKLNFKTDPLRNLYAVVSSLLWSVTAFFSPPYFAHEEKLSRYRMFALFTLSASLGVFFAADLLTAFFFFEMLSFASFPLVAQEENDLSLSAGKTYLFTSVLGGMLILLGLMKLYPIFQNFDLQFMAEKAQSLDKSTLFFPSLLVMLGFGAKAGLFPLNSWLPKAHPAAPAPASALLSGLLTKVGVFGIFFITFPLFLGFLPWGNVLLVLSLITMAVGALLALFSTNIKRTLACSSMSQIGFIMFGVSMQVMLNEESAIAFTGTVMHLLNHSLIKLLLFLIAGWLYMLTHSLNFNDLKGVGRKRPLLALCFLVGALSISGVPGFSGYISKTLLHESILEYIHLLHGHNTFWLVLAEKVFVVSGGLTFAYMTKLFVCIFLEKPERIIDTKPVSETKISIIISALFLLPLGLFPYALFNPLAQNALKFLSPEAIIPAVDYFATINLLGTGKSLLIGAIVYIAFVNTRLIKKQGRIYLDKTPKYIQIENIVKPAFEKLKQVSLIGFEKAHEFAEKL
ncbi:MAG: complex I subunit 5 family protein [Eubacteriales bacterium]|nr:complex I subunit 5 family protein [Eubacteriales bacterium]